MVERGTVDVVIELARLLRCVAALMGAALLVATGLAPDDAWREQLAGKALILLGLAAVTALVEVALVRRRFSPEPAVPAAAVDSARGGRRRWLWTALGVALVTAIVVQTWFALGKAIAAGDITPPGGSAWTDRLFQAWGGPDLGGPLALQLQLPWAVILRVVTFLHGSGADAQRVWITGLYVGASLATLWLLGVLGVRPAAAALGATLFVCNPYVVSAVVPNPVYLAAMVVLAGFPAAVLAAGRGHIRVRTGVLVIAAGAPLLGYAYQNPPLVGMAVLVLLASVPTVLWVDGRAAGRRAAMTALAGGVVLLLCSAYWIVPALAQLTTVNGSLASTSSWSWTEGRATIANAFWLNTAWGWIHPEYYPYASWYSAFPLSLLRFVMPALAFLPLAVVGAPGRDYTLRVVRRLALVAVLAIASLLIIFLSTGTNPPGSVLFEPLYALPVGWLLREPGRFLMIVGLTYGALLALGLDELRAPWRRITPSALPARAASAGRRVRAAVCMVAGVAVIVGPGYPLVAGAAVADSRGYLPSAHVSLPDFWQQMAQTVDAQPGDGAVLALPTKDFYQVPFSWGFYGTDAFMSELMHRQVIAPDAQGYLAPFTQLLSATRLAEADILAHDWNEAERLLAILRSPYLLVRGDIVIDPLRYPGRHMASPADLAASLDASADFRLVSAVGPLRLYQLRRPLPPPVSGDHPLATINSTSPDLRVLRLLPESTVLASTAARPGVARVEQLPRLENWRFDPGRLSTSVDVPRGWHYQLYDLAAPGAGPQPRLSDTAGWHVEETVGVDGGQHEQVSLDTVGNRVDDGSFTDGTWGPVGDCDNQRPGPQAGLLAEVVAGAAPDGSNALRVAASDDSACESTPVGWAGGALLLRYAVRHLSGSAPRICLYEVELYRCADIPEAPSTSTWSTASVMVTPDAGTETLRLFVYSDGAPGALQTVNDYADVTVLEFPVVPSVALVGIPDAPSPHPQPVLVQTTSFSRFWAGPPGASHVLVDGMVNGWIGAQTTDARPAYVLAPAVVAAALLSAVAALAALAYVLVPRVRARRRRETA